jgi:hypothetical protein
MGAEQARGFGLGPSAATAWRAAGAAAGLGPGAQIGASRAAPPRPAPPSPVLGVGRPPRGRPVAKTVAAGQMAVDQQTSPFGLRQGCALPWPGGVAPRGATGAADDRSRRPHRRRGSPGRRARRGGEQFGGGAARPRRGLRGPSAGGTSRRTRSTGGAGRLCSWPCRRRSSVPPSLHRLLFRRPVAAADGLGPHELTPGLPAPGSPHRPPGPGRLPPGATPACGGGAEIRARPPWPRDATVPREHVPHWHSRGRRARSAHGALRSQSTRAAAISGPASSRSQGPADRTPRPTAGPCGSPVTERLSATPHPGGRPGYRCPADDGSSSSGAAPKARRTPGVRQ